MLLQVNHLDAFYGRLQALWDVSVEVEQGEIIALIGATGGQVHLPQVHRRFHQAHFGKSSSPTAISAAASPAKLSAAASSCVPRGVRCSQG